MTTPDIQARLVEGGSRELDGELCWTLERSKALRTFWNASMGLPRELPDDYGDLPEGLGKASLGLMAPKYSTSVDAALALAERVLPGWFWSVRKNVTSGHLATVFALNEPPWTGSAYEHMEQGTANTPAAALCIAILKAKALQDGRDG